MIQQRTKIARDYTNRNEVMSATEHCVISVTFRSQQIYDDYNSTLWLIRAILGVRADGCDNLIVLS